jgi:hypothetical protein
MWNKIYLAVLAVAVVVLCFFTFYSNSWLGSIGDPKATKDYYEFYSGLSWTILWISSLILLILANILLWKTRRGWAMWTTFLFFAVFTIVRYFWLEQTFFAFKKSNGLWQGEFSLTPVIGVILIVIAAAVVFLNQFLNLRSNEKMYPPVVAETDLQPVEEEQN